MGLTLAGSKHLEGDELRRYGPRSKRNSSSVMMMMMMMLMWNCSGRKGSACCVRLWSAHQSRTVVSQGRHIISVREGVGRLVGRCNCGQSEGPHSRQVHYRPTQVLEFFSYRTAFTRIVQALGPSLERSVPLNLWQHTRRIKKMEERNKKQNKHKNQQLRIYSITHSHGSARVF